MQNTIRKYKVPIQRIERVFISHMHGDHVLGLPGLIGSMNLLGRSSDLHLYGPTALEAFLTNSLKWTETYCNFPIHFHLNDPKDIQQIHSWGDNRIQSIPVKHRIEAYGYSFIHESSERNIRKEAIEHFNLSRTEILQLKKSKSIRRPDGVITPDDACFPMKNSLKYVFSGDTAPCKNLIIASEGADLLYHEATFKQELAAKAKSTGHSTAAQAGVIARTAGVKNLLIGHFSNRYRKEDELLEEARNEFPSTQLAAEGQKFCI